MSVTDDIVEEIVTWCIRHKFTVYSREIIGDYITEETTMTSLVDEIEKKLIAKGIAVEA